MITTQTSKQTNMQTKQTKQQKQTRLCNNQTCIHLALMQDNEKSVNDQINVAEKDIYIRKRVLISRG